MSETIETKSPVGLNIFSFRAECRHDVDLFKTNLMRSSIGYEYVLERPCVFPDGGFMPDLCVELATKATWIQLVELMDNQIDSHVMIESLRQIPLKDNNCERDRSVYEKYKEAVEKQNEGK